jgi:hypothetical protein
MIIRPTFATTTRVDNFTPFLTTATPAVKEDVDLEEIFSFAGK